MNAANNQLKTSEEKELRKLSRKQSTVSLYFTVHQEVFSSLQEYPSSNFDADL